MLAGGSNDWTTITSPVGTLVASVLSSTMFLGDAGFAYETQAGPYVLFPQAAGIDYVLGAIYFGRYLRRSRATTVAGFFGQRFDSRRVQAVAGYTTIRYYADISHQWHVAVLPDQPEALRTA